MDTIRDSNVWMLGVNDLYKSPSVDGWWLATTIDGDSKGVWFMEDSRRRVARGACNAINSGEVVRPLVRLKSAVTMTWDEIGNVWNLSL